MISRFLLGVIAGGLAPSGGPTDPYYSDVVLLPHFDGTNGSTSMPDSSSYAQTLTASGSAALTTANKVAGTASLRLSGGKVLVSSATSLRIPGELTLEMFVYKNNNTGFQCAGFVRGDTGVGLGIITYPTATKLAIVDHGGSTVCADPDDFPTGAWTHVELGRDASNNIYLFVGGALKATGSFSSSLGVTQGDAGIGVWIDTTNFIWDGDIDEVRLTNGVCRHTSGFTPPTPPFPNA